MRRKSARKPSVNNQPEAPSIRPARLMALLAALLAALAAYFGTAGWRQRLKEESALSRRVVATVEGARSGQAERAARERELKERLRADPEATEARLALAQLRWSMTGPAAAVALLDSAPARSVDGRLVRLLAGAHRAAGREDLALQTLDRGIREFPEDGDLWLERATLFSWMGWFEPAQRALQAAEARSADPVRTTLIRIMMARQQRELRTARRLLEEALRKHPHDPELHQQAAVVAETEGRTDEAMRLLERLVAKEPDPELLVSLARLRLQRPDAPARRQARSELELALALRSGLWSARLLLGRCLRMSGELTEARSILEKLYQEQPGRPGVAHELAQLYRDLGMREKAAPLLAAHQRALRAREKMRRAALAVMSHPNSSEAHQTMGQLCVERRLIGRAILSFERSLELEPGQPDVRAELARLRREYGRRAGEPGESSSPDEH